MQSSPLALAAGSFILPVLLAGCVRTPAERVDPSTGGNPARAPQIIRQLGCGSCHTIAGVGRARGEVGPPLDGLVRRAYLAGVVPNTPENLVRWIRDPRSMNPRTAMPAVGATEQQARDIAAFLRAR